MPWIVGIDEAGYGPNLGPFVMSAVACRVADGPIADLWHVLRAAVRRHGASTDDRLLIDDSKLVYAAGLASLEVGVHAVLMPIDRPLCLDGYLRDAARASHADVGGECWYTGQTALPVEVAPAELATAAAGFRSACAENRIAWGRLQSVVVVPGRFNAVLEKWGTKGAVLGQALAALLRCTPVDGEPLFFFIDKHGGRNRYAAMLQDALPDGTVVVREEGRDRSVYGVLGLSREMQLTIQPRADAEHFCVALASMASKYLRELLMLEFNQFWRTHVPGLKPTAGYPGDAARFYEAIQPAAQRLGISDDALWRRK